MYRTGISIRPELVLSIYAENKVYEIKTKNKHQKLCEKLETCRRAKELIGDCNVQSTKYLLSLNKGNLCRIVGILTGHNFLRYQQYIIGFDTSTCNGCGETTETALRNLKARYSGDSYTRLEAFQKIPISNNNRIYQHQ